jgi:Integrase core domain
LGFGEIVSGAKLVQRLMAGSGIICSMSRSGNVWDNAAMESFFSSLKTERTERETYPTRNEARAVFDYIERFYNATGARSWCSFGSASILMIFITFDARMPAVGWGAMRTFIEAIGKVPQRDMQSEVFVDSRAIAATGPPPGGP